MGGRSVSILIVASLLLFIGGLAVFLLASNNSSLLDTTMPLWPHPH